MQLIGAVETELALLARADDPLDTSSVTKLPQVLYIWVNSNDLACTLVTSNAVRGIHHLHTEGSPFIMEEGLVRGAEAGPIDFYKDLTYLVSTVDVPPRK